MSWLSDYFHPKNPADEANKYIGQIPGQVHPYFDPYIQAGQRSIPNLEEQYNQLLTNPSDKLGEFGQGYQQSPGFKFSLQQALQSVNGRAAAGGMAGSPQNNQQDMEVATQLSNQDYYNYLNHVMGLYGQGLSGEQGLYSGGQNASTNMANSIAQTLAQQGNLAFQGGRQQNQNNNDFWGSLASIAGAFL